MTVEQNREPVRFVAGMPEKRLPDRAILLAGGRGSRLGGIGGSVPKPLLPVQGVPVIERLIARLREGGVRSCTVVTCHHAAQIEAHLGDGGRLGMDIDFLREPMPLGTGGCLALIRRPDRPFFLVNADVVTDLCFQTFAKRHVRQRALATVAVRLHQTAVEFGVVDFDADGRMTAYREKPSQDSFIGLGIYCLDPSVCDRVTPGEAVSMPEVLDRLLGDGVHVFCHRHEGLWHDIGNPDAYAESQSLRLPRMENRRSGRAA